MAKRGGNSTRNTAGNDGGSRQRACQKGHDQNSDISVDNVLQLTEFIMREIEGGGEERLNHAGENWEPSVARGRTKTLALSVLTREPATEHQVKTGASEQECGARMHAIFGCIDLYLRGAFPPFWFALQYRVRTCGDASQDMSIKDYRVATRLYGTLRLEVHLLLG